MIVHIKVFLVIYIDLGYKLYFKMASGGGVSKMSEETFDFICNSCAKENLTKEAIQYCEECREFYCSACVQMHAKFAGLAGHSLLDISTIQDKDKLSRLPSFPTERCSIHQGKVVDMYCGDHDTVGCYVCIAIDHKNCNDVHSVSDDIHQISTDGDYDKTCTNLQSFIERLQTMIKMSTDDYSKKIDDLKQNALIAVTEDRREIDATFDHLEENSRREIEARHEELKSQLLAASSKLESMLNECIELELKLKQVKGNKSQSLVCSKLIEAAINKKRECIKNLKKDLQLFAEDHLLSYTKGYRLAECLSQLKTLGTTQGNVNLKEEPYIVTGKQSIHINILSDRQICTSFGSCIFNEKFIMIPDRNNRKLKRMNMTQLIVTDYIDLTYDITGVCNVNNKEVAVSCYADKMIQFVSVGQAMKQTRQLRLNHICFQVSYLEDKLYVTDDTGRSLYIYDMVGTLLQTISTDSKGNQLFNTLSVQIALCSEEDEVFVTDFGGELVCLDKKGNHIYTTKDSSMNGAYGVIRDGRGNIFVSGRISNNIVQLGYDGKMRGIIVKEGDGIKQPMSLCFIPDEGKLFVTMMNNVNMMVYDLK